MTPEQLKCIGDALGMKLVQGSIPVDTGKGRTAFACTAAGDRVVVKWLLHWGEWTSNAVGYSAELIRREYPTARTIAHGPVSDGYGMIQQRLPGHPAVAGLSRSLFDQILAAVELQAEAPSQMRASIGGSESWASTVVFGDAMGWWRSARARGPEVVEFCAELAFWLRRVPRPKPRFDFVHYDLNCTNVLHEDGRLTGIIDIDNLGIGDRSIDLVDLAFEYAGWSHDGKESSVVDAVEQLMERVLRISGRGGWRQAVAYHGIAHLGWIGPGQVPTGKAMEMISQMMEMDD